MKMSKDHSWISSIEGVLTEMPEEKTKTQKSDWEDWKKTCAYLNCSSESQSRLGDFGVSRMLKWLGRAEGMTQIFSASENCMNEAWQWLDVHIIQKDSRGGTRIGGAKEAKASKDWLFDREGLMTVEDIEKYFTQGFFRAAAQEYARSNRSSSISADQPISSSQDSLTYLDLLPDERTMDGRESALIEDFMDVINEVIDEEFSNFPKTSKVAILGNALGISLDNVLINKITNKKKSALYDHVKRGIKKIADKIKLRIEYKEEPIHEDVLNCIIEDSLEKISLDWGKNPENSVLEVFDIA